MSIWSRISEAVAALVARGEALSAFFDRRRAPPERSVAFTIAVVSLGAKMAKADGQVRPVEVAAFRDVFQIAPKDEAAAAFYKHFDFTPLQSNERRLYLPMKTVASVLG